MKALPVESTAASFRAAHDPGAPGVFTQGSKTSAVSDKPLPRLSPTHQHDTADPHAVTARPIGPHELALGPSPTDTDQNPRSTR